MKDGIANERIFQKLLYQMNLSSPSKRIHLSKLLKMEKPFYEGKDGKRYQIDRNELLLINEAIQHLGIHDVKIPIILFADATGEQSMWRIEGEDESKIVSEIIDRKFVRDGRLILYSSHLSDLRKKLPTATVCIFLS